MVSLSFPNTAAPPSVRRPVFTIQFGGGGGAADSGLGGLVSAVGEALGVDLGGGADPWAESLVALSVECGLAPYVDVVELHLAAEERAPTVALGDAGSVSLGYEDADTTLVFTGQAAGVRHGVGTATRVTATNGAAALARLRVNQSYEQQTAGDIVRDLAGQAGVATGTVEAGVDFPFYVVDDRRGVYGHIAALARKSGYLAYLTPDGNLTFAPFTGGEPVQTFTYGVDVLALDATEGEPEVGKATTWGEGAAGSQGQDAWCWLVKDLSPVTGSAGDGSTERFFPDRSLRTGEAAQMAAEGMAAAASLLRITGRLLVPGAPAVTVGSVIAIAEAPQDVLNGLFLVRGVRHLYSKREGFRTLIVFSKAGGNGAGGSLLGAAAAAVGGLL